MIQDRLGEVDADRATTGKLRPIQAATSKRQTSEFIAAQIEFHEIGRFAAR